MARKKRTEAKSRRHLRATTNGRAKNTNVVEWEDIDFTMEGLMNQYKAEDEFRGSIKPDTTTRRQTFSNSDTAQEIRRIHPILINSDTC
jgi:hypothetical protein